MTSLVTRNLHSLLPRMARARLASSHDGVKMFSPLVISGDLMVVGQRWFTLNTPAFQVKIKKEPTKWDRKSSKVQQGEMIDKKLNKLDMDVRKNRMAHSFELEDIVRIIESNGVCSANQALLVLRCCGEVLVDLKRETRTMLVERYSNTLKQKGVVFDVSHYNALLRVHLENQNNLAPQDFLADMESVGITPNRVTFQHLVHMYCMEGNIAGATAIMQQMKVQDIPINEAVFTSLLKGHCSNNDTNSVSATIKAMSSSGLSLGVDSYTAMACSYGRSGNWAKVGEILERVAEEDVMLHDGDLFSIILCCSQGGLCNEAESLVVKLPRKREFFIELRNHLPQLAMSGNVNVAVEIFLSLKDQQKNKRDGKEFFVVSSIARSGESFKVILEAVKRIEKAGYTSAIEFLVQEVAQSWNEEMCKMLGDIIKKEWKGRTLDLNNDMLFLSLRRSLKLERNIEKTIASLNNLHAMGVAVPWVFISSDLIPAMLNLDRESPGITARKLKSGCPFIPWYNVTNMMLTSLFNKESAEHLSAATGFLLNVPNIGHIIPVQWNASLARAYLQTNRIEDLITIMFLTSRKSLLGNEPDKTVVKMFLVLVHIISLLPRFQSDKTAEQALTPVLEELVRLHIGVPAVVVEQLRKEVKGGVGRDLLDKAVLEWDNREEFWTGNEESNCKDMLKELFKESTKIERATKEVTKQVNYRRNFPVPDSRNQMEEIQALLASRGDVNHNLSGKLIHAYTKDGMFDQAMELLRYTQERSNFSCSPSNTHAIVTGLVDHGRGREALKLIEDQMEKDGKMWISSLMSALAWMAQADENQIVLDMLGRVDTINKFIISARGCNANTLLGVYSNKGDVQRVGEVFKTLLANNLASTENITNSELNPLVEVHLVKDDVKAAVVELRKIAKIFKKMPKKFEVTCLLIEEENVEALQEILDISIGVFGEEMSLYDLAHCFLHKKCSAQAKKLLETPGLRYDKGKVEYICTKLRDSGNLHGLENIVSLSKNILSCDRDYLYLQLVSAFTDDADKVEDIWVKVQEEGLTPSDSLKLAIATALKLGGKEHPFTEQI